MGTGAASAVAKIRKQSVLPPRQRSNSVPAIVEQLRTRRTACIRVTGRSMWPLVRAGDLIFAKSVSFDQVKRGQIAVFEREGRIIAHRVLSRIREVGAACESLVTKGDLLDDRDSPVNPVEFLGIVIRIHRGQRHIDLESLRYRAIGFVVARLSPASHILYSPLRLVYRNFAIH